ncbi:MAG: lysophospholipid transporter LplT [Herminiimonas sp.]|nr:lysophospholipid transporter LplT [Herminiimonas sp.]
MPATARAGRAFYAVVAAQFFSSLADNALLIAAIGLLQERRSSDWMPPALRLSFYLSYVLLAALAGPVADAWPKGRVLFATNLLKLCGCLLLLSQVHPLLAYALVGLGAAAYAPAKYGILPELLPPDALVRANAWIEVSTVVSILLGVALGSALLDTRLSLPQPSVSRAGSATAWIAMLYLLAALCTAAIGRTAPGNPALFRRPHLLIDGFRRDLGILWRDHDAQLSMAVTSLFWAVSATLQFIILRWAAEALALSLAQAALLQGAVAVGMVAGAVAAGRWIHIDRTLAVLPQGLAIGVGVLLMTLVTQVWIASLLLVTIGLLSGLFLVPMNALLQRRGQLLMHSGQSIAVQNFSENLASIVMLAAYGILLHLAVPLVPIILGTGVFVCVAMLLIMRMRRVQQGSVTADFKANMVTGTDCV